MSDLIPYGNSGGSIVPSGAGSFDGLEIRSLTALIQSVEFNGEAFDLTTKMMNAEGDDFLSEFSDLEMEFDALTQETDDILNDVNDLDDLTSGFEI